MVFTKAFPWLASFVFVVPVVAAEPASTADSVSPHDSSRPFVVLSDREVASRLDETEKFGAVEVLIRDPAETDRAIDDRALRLRDTRYFVYCGGQESPLTSLYRERFEAQGATVIDLHNCSPRRSPNGRRSRPHEPIAEQFSLASVLRSVP